MHGKLFSKYYVLIYQNGTYMQGTVALIIETFFLCIYILQRTWGANESNIQLDVPLMQLPVEDEISVNTFECSKNFVIVTVLHWLSECLPFIICWQHCKFHWSKHWAIVGPRRKCWQLGYARWIGILNWYKNSNLTNGQHQIVEIST